MIDVSEACRQAYQLNFINKTVTVYFPELDLEYSDEDVDKESLELRESILDSENFEFIGCLASYLKISIYNAFEDIQGQYMIVYVVDDETQERINLFHGYVDSSTKDSYSGMRVIEAFDVLYSLADKDMTDWYNAHYKTTIYNLLTELLKECDVTLEESYLANGDMTAFCGKGKKFKTLSALDILKHICQINGAFGKINRDGNFQLFYLGEKVSSAIYPAPTLFPSTNLYPATYGSVPVKQPDVEIYEYRQVNYEDFIVEPITKVTIRNSADVKGFYYGEGENNYIIQGNIFAYRQTEADIKTMARNIFMKIKDKSYRPFTSDHNGLPWLECGDSVFYDDIDINASETYNIKFFAFNRVLTGIQMMKDAYEAKGLQYQKKIITDLRAQLLDLSNDDNSDFERVNEELDELRKRVSRLESIVSSGSYLFGNAIQEELVSEEAGAGIIYDNPSDFVIGVTNV